MSRFKQAEIVQVPISQIKHAFSGDSKPPPPKPRKPSLPPGVVTIEEYRSALESAIKDAPLDSPALAQYQQKLKELEEAVRENPELKHIAIDGHRRYAASKGD